MRISTRRPAAVVASACDRTRTRPSPYRRTVRRLIGAKFTGPGALSCVRVQALAGVIDGVGVDERHIHRRLYVGGPCRDDQSDARDAEHESNDAEREHGLPGGGPRGRAGG